MAVSSIDNNNNNNNNNNSLRQYDIFYSNSNGRNTDNNHNITETPPASRRLRPEACAAGPNARMPYTSNEIGTPDPN